MRTLRQSIAPFLHPTHTPRISLPSNSATPTWAIRSFTATATATSNDVEALDLSYSLHDDHGKAKGDPIVIMHGLFGSKRNNRSVSNVFARTLSRPIYNLDLRNHGDSPQAKSHNYLSIARDVSHFLQAHNLRNSTLIGHSMGAKTVMTMALQDPNCCADIIAVDNAPVDAALHSDFPRYVEGMRKISEAKVMSQKEADAVLEPYAKELPVRQFLLTNLVRPSLGEPYTWKIPVKTLGNALDDMADFPFKNPDEVRFSGRALFVRGTKSHYVSDETLPIIGRFFPRFELVDVEAGHWVISEKPEEFITRVVEFLREGDE